jgi:hypothetical protein
MRHKASAEVIRRVSKFHNDGLPVADTAMCCSYKLAGFQQALSSLLVSNGQRYRGVLTHPGDMLVLGNCLPRRGDFRGAGLVPA